MSKKRKMERKKEVKAKKRKNKKLYYNILL